MQLEIDLRLFGATFQDLQEGKAFAMGGHTDRIFIKTGEKSAVCIGAGREERGSICAIHSPQHEAVQPLTITSIKARATKQ